MRVLIVLLVSVATIALVIYFRRFKDNATRKDATLACGAVIKLDATGIKKLGLFKKLSGIVADEFTEEEAKQLRSTVDIQELAFSAYSLGFLTWEKSKEVSQADYDKSIGAVTDAFKTENENLKDVSPVEKAQLDMFKLKIKRMSSKAFAVGRHDAQLSPCPF